MNFCAEQLEALFGADSIESFVDGGCLDFAAGLSLALQGTPHAFAALLAPDGRRKVVAHVMVTIEGRYLDAEGVHDKTELLDEWAWRNDLHWSKLELLAFESLDEIRAKARKLRCVFDSDSADTAARIARSVQPLALCLTKKHHAECSGN